jgi:hypothetical protein
VFLDTLPHGAAAFGSRYSSDLQAMMSVKLLQLTWGHTNEKVNSFLELARLVSEFVEVQPNPSSYSLFYFVEIVLQPVMPPIRRRASLGFPAKLERG